MKKIISFLIVFSMLFTFSFSNAYALEAESNNFYQLDDGVIWGENINGTLYAAIISDDNSVYFSKATLNDDCSDIFYKELTYTSTSPWNSKNYWNELIAYAENTRTTWNIVNGITHSNVITRSNATNIILADLAAIYGRTSDVAPRLLKTDSSSYSGYTFRVYEMLTLGTRQTKKHLFSVTTSITNAALSIIETTGVACTVASVVSGLCDMYDVTNVNGSYVAEGTEIYTFLDTGLRERFVTVNGGNTPYSSTYKKDYYISLVDGLNFTVSSPIYESTIYDPSSAIYNDSTYNQLIRIAYNNYV